MQLEVFRKTLMQSLQEEDDNSVSYVLVNVAYSMHSSYLAQLYSL